MNILVCYVFIFCHVLTQIHYNEFDFTFELLGYVRYSKISVTLRFCFMHFTSTLAGLKNIVHYIEDFVK